MNRLGLLVGACIALIAAWHWLFDGVQDRPIFHSTSRMVPIYATVRGYNGRLIPDLTRNDFHVFEDGHERPLTVFDNAPQTITVAVMFDMSTSMAKQYTYLRRAAGALVDALWPADRARIGSFGVEVALSPLLTSDKSVLRRILDEELWPGGPTALWYATDRAMTALDEEPGRRIVLLFTDGDDAPLFGKQGDLGATTRHAESGGFMIYAVGLPGRALSARVRELADETGGGHVGVRSHDDLPGTFARVVDELHHQYVLGFESDLADGRLHSIDVRTGRVGATVRARKSYVAVVDGAIR